jgi:hypothetical protein
MTPLPNIPTDNLYKFIFIAGLTIILTGLVILVTQYNSITNSLGKLEFEVGKIESESAYLRKEASELGIELKALDKKTSNIKADSFEINQHLIDLKSNLLNDKNYREYLSFLFAHESDLVPYSKEFSKLMKINEILEAKQKQITLNGDIIMLKIRQLRRETIRLVVISILLSLMMFTGYRIANSGYHKWYTLVQKPADEKLNLELLELKKKQE